MSQCKGKTRTGKSETEAAEKRRKALEMRKAGCGYVEIAAALGYSNAGGAYKVVQKALKDTYREPADAIRTLELERVDRIMRAVWPRALQGDVEAIDRVLKVMDRRARLLGLDRGPVPAAVVGDDAGNGDGYGDSIAELERRFNALRASRVSVPISGESNGEGGL